MTITWTSDTTLLVETPNNLRKYKRSNVHQH